MSAFVVCLGLLGLLYIALVLNVSRYRISRKVSLGDGGDPDLTKAIRAHANLIETAPITLILIFVASFMYGFRTVAFLSVALLVSRVIHAGGMLGYVPQGRRMGTILGLVTVLIASLLVAAAGLGVKPY